MSALLSIDDLHVDRGEMPVLRGVELAMESGELCLLTGPNGVGKSTLVECLTGRIPPASGRITFDGTPIERWGVTERVRLGIGSAPEGRRLFESLSVVENLRIAGRVWGLTTAQIAERTSSVLAALGALDGMLGRRVGTLSGGERQFVAIARALLTEPRLLVLDEPSFGLSPGAWGDVLVLCRRLADDGTSVLLVEQKVLDSAAHADRVLVIRRGVALEVGHLGDSELVGLLAGLADGDGPA